MKTLSQFIPVTPGDTPLPHLSAPTEEKAWENLIKEASHMPWKTKEGFMARGYAVEKWK